MKTAIIVPEADYVDIAAKYSAYHMALGQLLVKSPDYLDAYKNYAHAGHFVIVDNGAAEPEEERVDFKDIVKAAARIRADEIVLPDVLYEMNETLRLSQNATSLVEPRQRVFIPQGNNPDEWKYCLDAFEEGNAFATIGVPKHMEKHSGGRAALVRWLISNGFHQEHHIHLFGIWKNPIKEVQDCLEQYDGIRGIDTAAPFAYAQNGCRLVCPQHYSMDPEKDLFAYVEVFEDNILLLMEACNAFDS